MLTIFYIFAVLSVLGALGVLFFTESNTLCAVFGGDFFFV